MAHLYPFSLPSDQQSSVPNPPASLDTPWLRGIPSSWNMIMTKKIMASTTHNLSVVSNSITMCIHGKHLLYDYNVGKTITSHPQVITIFIGGMFTMPKWVLYGIVLPT